MEFNSLEFIFIFLTATYAGFHFLVSRSQTRLAHCWLVVASLIFYGYWNPAYLLLICGSICANFYLGRRISACEARKRRLLLAVGIIFNLGLLGYFKYANFFVDSVNALSGTTIHLNAIALPLAISFFTFQQIAFLVDTYRRTTAESDFLHYCLFVTFFPQLIAGPIVHHREMAPQFIDSSRFKATRRNLAIGLTVFAIGLTKKTLIADSLSVYADPVFAAADAGVSVSMIEAWGGVLAYTFQIYFDFSGYSDMAIGLAKMFGIDLPLNFLSPYRATNISEFWRRWHITLSRFLRDYLYIPLGGNRQGATRTIVSVSVTMLLGGLWHGAAWTFVVWGGLHACFLLINRLWRRMFPGLEKHASWRALAWAVTFLSVAMAWVFFRSGSIESAWQLILALGGGHDILLPESYLRFLSPVQPFLEWAGVQWIDPALYGGRQQLAILTGAAFVAFCLPNTYQIMSQYLAPPNQVPAPVQSRLAWRPAFIPALVMGGIAAVAVAAISRTSPFVYFNF